MTVAARTSLLGNWYAMFTTEQIVEFAQSKGGNKMASKTQRRVDKNLGKVKSRDAWSAVRKLTEVGPDGKLRFLDQPPLLLRMPADVMKVNYRDMFDTFLATLGADKAALLSQFDPGRGAQGGRRGQRRATGDRDVAVRARPRRLAGDAVQGRAGFRVGAMDAPRAVRSARRTGGDRSAIHAGLRRPVPGLAARGHAQRRSVWTSVARLQVVGRLVGISATQLTRYAELCGATLAMAHARTGDPAAISAYLGSGPKFAKAMSRFARTYPTLRSRTTPTSWRRPRSPSSSPTPPP